MDPSRRFLFASVGGGGENDDCHHHHRAVEGKFTTFCQDGAGQNVRSEKVKKSKHR